MIVLCSCGKSIPSDKLISASQIQIADVTDRQMTIADEAYTLTATRKSKDSKTWVLKFHVKFCLGADNISKQYAGPPSIVFADESKTIIEGAEMKLGESSTDLQLAKQFKDFIEKSAGEQFAACFYLNTDDEKLVESIMNDAAYVAVVNIVPTKGGLDFNSQPSVAEGGSDSQAVAKVEGLMPDDILLPASLKGKVEVLNGPNGCIPVEISEYEYPCVSVTFRLIEKVNTAPLASAYGQLWIIGIGQDEAGRDVKELLPNYGEWRTDDSDGREFKEFLEGEPGETITMTFTGDKGVDPFEKDEAKLSVAREKVNNAIPRVKKFKLKITK